MKLRNIILEVRDDLKIYTKTVPDLINTGFTISKGSPTKVDWYKIYPFDDIKNDPLMGKAAKASFKNKISYIISERKILIPNKYYITSQLPIYWVYCDDNESVHITKFKI
jgi:hypothetical protein